jgi:hypothetical protein
MTIRFIAMGENKTSYVAEIEYSKFNGFVPKMMVFLMPAVFKIQIQKSLISGGWKETMPENFPIT